MEESFVVHAIQNTKFRNVRDRYRLFDNEEERDKEFDFMGGRRTTTLRKVTLVIQVDDASVARLF